MGDVPSIISYRALRKSVGLLGIGLVPVVVLGSYILDTPHVIQISVSAYYYTSMRNVFEGILFGIGLFLICYDGYRPLDSVISKLAGVFALCIALFPTSSDPNDKTDIISKVHYITAGIFFACLAFMSIWLFTKSKGVMTDRKRKRNRVYRVCGIVMAVAVIGIPLDSIQSIHDSISEYKPTLILETIALTSFGFSWLTKGEWVLPDKPTNSGT